MSLELSRADEGHVDKEIDLYPTAGEWSVLDASEKAGFWLADRMNRGKWKRFWTFCQRHIGSLWIYLATYNLLNVHGLENLNGVSMDKPVVLVANHRSFFDMYTVSSVLFRRTPRKFFLYFPVRAKFFYESPLGWIVNLVMGWFSMYPPFFREEKEIKKREFDKFSLRRLIRLCAENKPNIIGFHPEGKRNLSADPYDFLPAQPGIGKVIYEAHPTVVPVFIAGLGNKLSRQVLGNWANGPKIRIWFGKPVELSKFYEKRNSLRTHKEIADFLMSEINLLAERDKAMQGAGPEQGGG
jgi:1-acyl-sn-glycerol-3-phosphate acyltransferase